MIRDTQYWDKLCDLINQMILVDKIFLECTYLVIKEFVTSIISLDFGLEETYAKRHKTFLYAYNYYYSK